ncbi:MAG: hypothetical protein M9916_00965 [Crocinitomicaceae bacterium]|nr:hypothetical protein [Crocinitomicaceae bacterium]
MYKYNIHTLLRKLSYEDYQISWKFFPERLSISTSTWKRWIYIKKDSSAQIPLCALVMIASFFEVEISELLNNQPTENVKRSFKLFKNAAL